MKIIWDFGGANGENYRWYTEISHLPRMLFISPSVRTPNDEMKSYWYYHSCLKRLLIFCQVQRTLKD